MQVADNTEVAVYSDLPDALRYLRMVHSVGQDEIAKAGGISVVMVSNTERGVTPPSLEVISAYAKCCYLSGSAILLFAENMGRIKEGRPVSNGVSRVHYLLDYLHETSLQKAEDIGELLDDGDTSI